VLPIIDQSQTIHVMTHLLVKVAPSSSSVSTTDVAIHGISEALDLETKIKNHKDDGKELHATHKVTIG
jgi:hypothetical protein